MTVDEKDQFYKAGYLAGKEHQTPSADTLKLIGELSEKREADHELLIRLDEGIKSIRTDIKDLKDGTTKRIECLEKEKADRHELEELQKRVNNDIEVRVRKLESSKIIYYTMTAIYAGIGSVMIGLIIWHMFQK
jgi:hypothetical protein